MIMHIKVLVNVFFLGFINGLAKYTGFHGLIVQGKFDIKD